MVSFLEFEKPIAELEARVIELRATASAGVDELGIYEPKPARGTRDGLGGAYERPYHCRQCRGALGEPWRAEGGLRRRRLRAQCLICDKCYREIGRFSDDTRGQHRYSSRYTSIAHEGHNDKELPIR